MQKMKSQAPKQVTQLSTQSNLTPQLGATQVRGNDLTAMGTYHYAGSAIRGRATSIGYDSVPQLPGPAEASPGMDGGLPDTLRSSVENLSGMALDNVKVHYNSAKPAQVGAHAYAQGSDIHLAPGQEKHLSHEAWHVVQQAQGRVKPTLQTKTGVSVNDDEGLEAEADRMGERAERMTIAPRAASAPINQPYGGRPRVTSCQAPVQRAIDIAGVRISSVNFKIQCLTEGKKLNSQWKQLTSEQRAQIELLVDGADIKVTADTLAEALNPPSSSSGVHSSEGSASTPATQTISLLGGTHTLRILNDSGGYHTILEHPTKADFIVRARKAEATPIGQGMANMSKLSGNLRRIAGIRVPEVKALSDSAYEVEKVARSVDALAMWNRIKSIKDDTAEKRLLQQRLRAISEIFQTNIAAMMERKAEPFPDFRPANVGEKDGTPDLIYIDFDQTGEVQERDTLIAHANEWAGKRFLRDPGGAREADPELFNLITGKLLDGMDVPPSSAARGHEDSAPMHASSSIGPLPVIPMPLAPLAPQRRADSLPRENLQEGLDGAGGYRLRPGQIPVDVNVVEGATIYVNGIEKKIHYISPEYKGTIGIDFVDAN
ncbi:eCIS core domain-containing protein [Collimonas silvisoli]|uniref:eCIS core domain-containing protein n=1 Tax=Collimonas silvisoli TaxID=2825884 RepID=UPI001E32F0F1|nr:DUF4157 domain-containing protein [Collimonas silvisoli]